MTRIQEGTSVGAPRCLALVRGIASRDRAERHAWAGVADEWFGIGEFDYTEDVPVAWVLAWAAVGEAADGPVRADLLDSLHGMALDDRVPVAALDLVLVRIDRTGATPAEADFLPDLELARSRPGPARAPGERSNPPAAAPGRALGPAGCLDLVRGLVAVADDERRAAAALVAGRVAAGELDDDEARTVAAVLVWAVEVDTTPARPVLLAALGALAGRDRVPPRVLTRVVGHLGHTTLSPVEDDMRADLAAHLARVSASG